MTGEKYDRLVRRAALEALAGAEGRLRAGAEEREASAERMERDLAELDLKPEQRLRAEGEVAALRREALAGRTEADLVRRRAALLARGPGNVSRAPAAKKPAPPVLEDVVHTLKHAASLSPPSGADPGADGPALLAEALADLKALPGLPAPDRPARLAAAKARLARVAWAAGESSAFAQRALAEMDRAVACLPA